MQTDALEVLSPASKNVAGDGSPQFIRPEHLSPIILSSHADYLIVIGDKNMRKRSCQVRFSLLQCFVFLNGEQFVLQLLLFPGEGRWSSDRNANR